MKCIKCYSLELYTLISLLLLTISAIFIRPDVTQQIALAYIFLFVLHEWEKGHYPGGFIDMMAGVMLGGADNVTIEATRNIPGIHYGLFQYHHTEDPWTAQVNIPLGV